MNTNTNTNTSAGASDWRGLVIADDLTGATDTGHAVAARGHRVVVPVGGEAGQGNGDPELEPGGVVVVDTDSRYRPPAEAARRVVAAIERRDADRHYKKIDSTLRGNVVAELDAALGATGASLAAFAPAFPANGRTTACGYHLVDGTVVTRTPPGNDPDAPVASSRLGALLADARAPVERVGVDRVARDADAVAAALADRAGRHAGPVVAACDATRGTHLARVAAGAADCGVETLPVGSAGLAAHVEFPPDPDAAPASVDPGGGRVLGVAGSTHPRTLDGLAALPDSRVVPLDAALAARDPEAAAERAAAAARERFGAGDVERAVVASARDEDDVAAALAAADAAGIDHARARDRIEAALAGAAARVVRELPPEGLFLTGGAVARAVLSRAGATAVELTGEAVAAGVPVGRVAGGPADGAAVVTKAGGFGERTTVMGCLAYLSGDE